MNFGLKNKNNKTTYQAPAWTNSNTNKIGNFEKIGASVVKKKTSTDSTEKDKKDDYQYTSAVTPAKTTSTTNTLPLTTPTSTPVTTPKKAVTQTSAPSSSPITTTTSGTTNEIEKIKQPYEDILPKTSEKTEATPLKITGRQIKQNVYNIISKTNPANTYKADIFDDIDDNIVEKSIPVAEQAIDTNLKTGKLTQNSLKKFPYLRDGLTMFYAAGEKGNKKAAQAAMKSAYVEEKPKSETAGLVLSNKNDEVSNTIKKSVYNFDLPKTSMPPTVKEWKEDKENWTNKSKKNDGKTYILPYEDPTGEIKKINDIIKEKGVTGEHAAVMYYADNIKCNSHYEWKDADFLEYAVKTITAPQEADKFVHDKKISFVKNYKNVILDASEKYDVPPMLLAGVAYNEFGGDAMWFDDAIYAARNLYDDNIAFKIGIDGTKSIKDFYKKIILDVKPGLLLKAIPEKVPKTIFDYADEVIDKIPQNSSLTSFGNTSIQVRRAIETLGYDESTKKTDEIIKSLKDPIQDIYITALHLSQLCDIDYKNVDRSLLTDEQIKNVISRYQIGPKKSLKYIIENNGYGEIAMNNKEAILKALK